MKNNLQKALSNYIDHFGFLNNSENNETYKWAIVAHFQKHWDLNATDFSGMFRLAIAKTSNLINNSVVQPLNGILRASIQEPETVRGFFAKLTDDDGGDLELRQKKLWSFLADINSLMDRYNPGQWKCRLEFRSAMMLSSLIHPDKDYMYKATQVKNFASYIGWPDELGSGTSFSLQKYYAFCDTLVVAIKNEPKLLQAHQSRWNSAAEDLYPDTEYHILAYDIMYCVSYYNLCEGMQAMPEKAKLISRGESALATREAKSHETLMLLQKRLTECQAQIEEIEEINAVGQSVRHDRFGLGTIVLQEKDRLVVRFPSGNRQFSLPAAFAERFLIPEDDELVALSLKYEQLLNNMKAIKLEVALARL